MSSADIVKQSQKCKKNKSLPTMGGVIAPKLFVSRKKLPPPKKKPLQQFAYLNGTLNME